MTTLQTALAGETPPLVTPFDENGAVDHDALAAVVDHVESGGVDGLFPCGTTGEFASLTAEEQTAVIETVVDASDDAPVVAGVSAPAIDDAVAKAEAAADAGADAVVSTPPYFHTSKDPAGVEAFFAAVADRSPLPLLLYNIPVYVGSSIDVTTVASLAGRDDVLAIKDSSGDLDYTLDLVRETPEDVLVLQGYDTLLLPGLRTGLDGGVNALANVVPEVFETILAEPQSETARRASDAITPLFDACDDHGFASVSKAGLVHRGVIDSAAVRPPLTAVPDDEYDVVGAAIEEALDAI
ncbi:dihydrodipicolinate synthase family protein [Salinarchaeum laminariae]|uniref:dihydrodipicolinate synthase family protein n=1 Tax=Salinarchaeum laminariae TaxID=869888 RepID=UPI0020BD6EE0|nr:dihydrodipicolinate synthase family protein [Salinarchaeum laminariae]